MKIVRCPVGHFFDSVKYAVCPYCEELAPCDVSTLSEEQKKIYHLTLNLKDKNMKVELDLPGWNGYYDVLDAMAKEAKLNSNLSYKILGWKQSESGALYCRLYDYDETELYFDVEEQFLAPPISIDTIPFVLYGCPMSLDIKVAEKSERPVRIIRFGEEE